LVEFDSAFTFKYSPRPPAKSTAFKDSVSKEIKEERLKLLSDAQTVISKKRNEPYINRDVEILVDGCGKKGEDSLSGRTRSSKITVFKGSKELIGKFVDVKVESVTPYSLKGRIVR
jgi:tRNA-2-methylthio-N6-dimethylallyladenosine synthase